MTGWYPHVAGHRTLDNLLKQWEPNLLRSLSAAGYFVAWPGVRGDTFSPGVIRESTDFFGYSVRPSLDTLATRFREAFPEGDPLRHAHYVGRIEEGVDFDEATVQTTIQLIGQGIPEPFVLLVTLFAPHPPFGVSEPWYSLHERTDIRPPAVAGGGKPRFMRALRDATQTDGLDPDAWAEITGTYWGMVARADDQLGRIVSALESAGQYDRTVAFSFTDHGDYMGDYGLIEKWPSGLDACLLRNPLIVAGPGVTEGLVHGGMVEMIDLPTTICEMAETEQAHAQFGRSLVPVLDGSSASHRLHAFSEGGFRLDEERQNEPEAAYPYDVKTQLLHTQPELVGRAVCVRTTDWTFVHRTLEGDELYDRSDDPEETTNVASLAENATIVGELRQQLFDWLIETSDVVPEERDPRMEQALVEEFLDRP